MRKISFLFTFGFRLRCDRAVARAKPGLAAFQLGARRLGGPDRGNGCRRGRCWLSRAAAGQAGRYRGLVAHLSPRRDDQGDVPATPFSSRRATGRRSRSTRGTARPLGVSGRPATSPRRGGGDTNATPVADPYRQFLYAAAPDRRDPQARDSGAQAEKNTPIAPHPRREKIASALNFFKGRVIAATDGYIGDRPPYQGHVAGPQIRRAELSSARMELAGQRQARAPGPGLLFRERLRDCGKGRRRCRRGRGRPFPPPGDRPLGRKDELGRRCRRARSGGDADTRQLHADRDRAARRGGWGKQVHLARRDSTAGKLTWRRGRLGPPPRLEPTSGFRSPARGRDQPGASPSGGRTSSPRGCVRADSRTWIFAADRGATSAWTVEEARLKLSGGAAQRRHEPGGGRQPGLRLRGGGGRVYEATSSTRSRP